MLKVTIEDGVVNKRTIPGKNGGESFQVMSQTAILRCGRYTYPLNLRLNGDQAPYAPGDYLIDDESFGIDEYDNVSIRRGGLKLKSALEVAARARPTGTV